MKQKWKVTAGILTVVVCMLFGCEKKSRQGESLLIVPVDESVQRESLKVELTGESRQETAAEDVSSLCAESDGAGQAAEEKTELVVHICGAVNNPGVYILEEGSRIYQAIEKAGGFGEEAEADYLNQADLLADGMKIYVPTKEEVADQNLMAADQNGGLTIEVNDAGRSTLVNINTASTELLCTLPGVGEGKAQSIITYRETHGKFQTAEDIMKVDGIKEGLFRKIRDKITV